MKKSDLKISWDLSQLGAKINDSKFITERKKAKKSVVGFVKKYKGKSTYLTSAKQLKNAIATYEAISEFGTKEDYYYALRDALDSSDVTIKGPASKAGDFYTKLFNELEFFLLDLGKIKVSEQKKLLKNKELESERHFLKRVFDNAQYSLSEEVEQLLSLKSGVSHGNWTSMVDEFLSKETLTVQVKNRKGKYVPKKMTCDEVINLCADTDKQTRTSAKKSLDEMLAKHGDVAEKEINSILENKKINDELRGYTRPDQARHISDDIDSDVVDALVTSVVKNKKIAHEFYKFKAQLMKQKQITYQERAVAIGESSTTYTYPQAVSIVHDAFSDLDSDFANIFKSFSIDGYTDVMPKKGKTGGAFCAGHSKSIGSYILLNFTGKVRDITTIAHEAGHGINNQLIKRKQRSLYCGTPLSTAEVASTFCEDFALKKIAETITEDEERFTLSIAKLEDDIATVFRQIGCYRFEQELHGEYREKGYLSKQDISNIFTKHMQAYMGSAVSFDAGADYWWVYWSHIRSFFYVYSYVSGVLISKSMQGLVQDDHQNMTLIKDVFYSAGTSDSPKNIFKQMRIDITKSDFWQKGIDQVASDLQETKKLAKKLGKI